MLAKKWLPIVATVEPRVMGDGGFMTSAGRSESRPEGANAYKAELPWAVRYTWDSRAFKQAFPENTLGRAASREVAERSATFMLNHQSTDTMPLIEVAVMGPGLSDWVIVARRPESVAVDGARRPRGV